jgi:hypothetical protein
MARYLAALVTLAACHFDGKSYPDAWSGAYDACADGMTAGCDLTIRGDLGDHNGYLVDSMFALVTSDADPWYYDMVAGEVDSVDYLWYDPGHLGASAHFLRHKVTLHDLEPFTGLSGASGVIHEAAHGYSGRGHIVCPDGEDQCDRWYDGAVDIQLQFLTEAVRFDPTLADLRERTASRLLVE